MPGNDNIFHDDALDTAIERIKQDFPEVTKVRYDLGDDWTYEPALFFRVLLNDSNHREEVPDAHRTIVQRINAANNTGMFPYVRFRSTDEQANLRDPKWE